MLYASLGSPRYLFACFPKILRPVYVLSDEAGEVELAIYNQKYFISKLCFKNMEKWQAFHVVTFTSATMHCCSLLPPPFSVRSAQNMHDPRLCLHKPREQRDSDIC